MKIYDRLVNKFWRTIILPKAKIKIGEVIYKVPRIQNNNFYKTFFQSESWLIKFLQQINEKKKINIFIDIGVNIGQTLLKIKSINSKVKYFGFEPNPFCCSVAQQVIISNNLSYCNLIPCALGDKNELLKLSLSDKGNLLDSSASIIKGFRKHETASYQFVNVFKLDDIIDSLQIDHIDLIKMDIEGAELEAIRGMKIILNKYTPIVILEVLPSYAETNEFRINRQKKLVELLKQANYSMFQIKSKEKDMIFEEINEFPVHENVNESDYLLLPNYINIIDFEFNSI